ncbi:hypothetical protein AOLI_G00227780 [Acnodon oligacanthus]
MSEKLIPGHIIHGCFRTKPNGNFYSARWSAATTRVCPSSHPHWSRAGNAIMAGEREGFHKLFSCWISPEISHSKPSARHHVVIQLVIIQAEMNDVSSHQSEVLKEHFELLLDTVTKRAKARIIIPPTGEEGRCSAGFQCSILPGLETLDSSGL